MTDRLAIEGQPPRRIAIFRALQLGDLLCTVPAFRAVRAAYPDAQITLIGLPWAGSFAERFRPYFDGFIGFPGYPDLRESNFDRAAFHRFLHEVRAQEFDAVLQLHGSGNVTTPLVQDFGAKVVAGHCPDSGPCCDPNRFLPWEGSQHEVRRFLSLLEHLGVPPVGEHLELPITDEDERNFRGIDTFSGLRSGQYVCVHPGARLHSRRWPVERFAEVAQALSNDGMTVVLTGTPSEAELTDEIAQRVTPPPINSAGITDLGSLAVLIRDARLLVCNDTGVSHVATALGTPSVVVACGSDVERWRPLDSAKHRVLHVPIECRPCTYEECPIGHPCATELTSDAVLAEARSLMSSVDPQPIR